MGFGCGRRKVLKTNNVNECNTRYAIIDRRSIGCRVADDQVAATDENEIGMLDLIPQSFAGNEMKRSEWLFPKPGLHVFRPKHGRTPAIRLILANA